MYVKSVAPHQDGIMLCHDRCDACIAGGCTLSGRLHGVQECKKRCLRRYNGVNVVNQDPGILTRRPKRCNARYTNDPERNKLHIATVNVNILHISGVARIARRFKRDNPLTAVLTPTTTVSPPSLAIHCNCIHIWCCSSLYCSTCTPIHHHS